jgi:pimeloyl-ACP methyl ester carboxylesterase
VLRNYIEHRERSLHGRDTNRKSLPFEWGTEYIAAGTSLREFSDSAVADSDGFYSYEPTDAYRLNGDLLRFPSAVQTPYLENNTVWGRFFDAGKDLAVVVLPQWNCQWDDVGMCRLLQGAGISALRLSMPYHHRRKPAHLERSEYLVSPNIGRTLSAARQSVLDARRAADWLLAVGHRRVGIVGTSIGSCIAFLTFAHDERFSVGVFIHVSGYFADVVWSGMSTSHVRRSLEGRIELDELRRLWGPISPFPFIGRLEGDSRPMLMISGEYDLTFDPDLSKHTYAEFRRRGIPVDVIWLPCGHYTMGKFPFNAVVAYKIVRFLRKSP